jgi:hypothetical protein
MLKNKNISLPNIKMIIKIMKLIYKEEANKYIWIVNKQAWHLSLDKCQLLSSGVELLQENKVNLFNQIVFWAKINIKVRKEELHQQLYLF